MNNREIIYKSEHLPLWFHLLLYIFVLVAFFVIFIFSFRKDTEDNPPTDTIKENQNKGDKEEIQKRGIKEVRTFPFTASSGFLGWNKQRDVLEISNTFSGLSLSATNPCLLILDGPVDAGAVSAIQVKMSNGFPSIKWKPYDSKEGSYQFRLPDLSLKEDRTRTTYYFFVEEDLTWKELVTVAFSPNHYSEEGVLKKISIRSISFLYLSPESRRYLEGKDKNRGTAKIGFETREVIFATPPKRFEKQFSLPEKPVLEFGYGMLNSCWNKPGDGVRFSVLLKDEKGKTHKLLDQDVDPKIREKDKKWFEARISLAEYAGKKVSILFETRHGMDPQYDYAVWSSPQVFNLQRNREDINILLISLDTLRADHLGCYGYSRNTSPTIDTLAEEGTLFTSAFSPASSTLTAHMSLMTSLLPCTHQVLTDLDQLKPEGTTLAEILKKKGYFNVAFTEDTYVAARFGFAQGFHRYHDGFRRFTDLSQKEIKNTFPAAREWIKNNAFKKFFIFLHTYETHIPYAPPPPFSTKFKEEVTRDFWSITKEAGFDENFVLGIGLKNPGQMAKDIMKHIPGDLLNMVQNNPTGMNYVETIENLLTEVIKESAKSMLQ